MPEQAAAKNKNGAQYGAVHGCFRSDGGAEGDRTPDLLIANEALSQLSYSPPPEAARIMVMGGREVKEVPLSFGAQKTRFPTHRRLLRGLGSCQFQPVG